jgi:putative flippase GtrA
MTDSSSPSLATLARRLSEVSVVRFGVVGVSNTVLGYTVFRGAHRVLPAAVSQALSYLVGMLWSYYWNRRWTFKSQGNLAREAARFFSLQIGFLLASAAMLGLLVDHLRQNPTASWIGTSALCTLLNFVASRFWAFKPA